MEGLELFRTETQKNNRASGRTRWVAPWAGPSARSLGIVHPGHADSPYEFRDRSTVDPSDTRQRFEMLAARWREETEFHSSPTVLFMNPAYQEIIGLGPAALPYIFADLVETRSLWFWALRAITGENPVPTEDRGNVARMTDLWLHWGHERGLLK